jgi:hypothetical protein
MVLELLVAELSPLVVLREPLLLLLLMVLLALAIRPVLVSARTAVSLLESV